MDVVVARSVLAVSEVTVAYGRHEVLRDVSIDVVPGRGGMFSLDNGRERRFLTRSEICAYPLVDEE